MRELVELPAPAMAEHASPRASKNYLFVPTTKIITELEGHGWSVSSAVATKSRAEGRAGYQKHMVRFRRNDGNQITLGDSIAELLLINGHDTSTSYRFCGGVYRLVCGNGMIVAETEFPGIRVPHRGSLEEIVAASLSVAERLPQLAAVVSAMKKIVPGDMQRIDFAMKALGIRFGDKSPLLAADVLVPRRAEDTGKDLWTLFNVVQENIMRGGQMGVLQNGSVKQVAPIIGMQKGIGVNEGLWELATEYTR